MSTPKTWDEGTWPQPGQLAIWLQDAEPEELVEFAQGAISAAQEVEKAPLREAAADRAGQAAGVAFVAAKVEAIADAYDLPGSMHSLTCVQALRALVREVRP